MKHLQLPLDGRYLILPARRGAAAGRLRVRAPASPDRRAENGDSG